MRVMFELFLLLCSLCCLSLAEARTYPVAKPECNATCGNVTFPFPFGIGAGCFLDDWYEIVCELDNSVPRLKKLDLQVLNISLGNYSPNHEGASVIVNYPIVHSNLSCGRNDTRQRMAFDRSPFIISSSRNTFVAVGCDNSATMQGTESSSFLGCKTQCIGANTTRYSICDGIDCCQSTIPSGLQGFIVDFQTENNIQGANGVDHDCQFAFVVYEDWFKPNTTDLYALRDGNYAPVMLEWGILNYSLPISLGIFPDPLPYSYDTLPYSYGTPSVCRTTSYINKNTTPFISCYCTRGYDGNPYLHYGCEVKAEAPRTYPAPKPGCNSRCGNVTFPFPFGIGAGCFLDDWYEIVCELNNNSVPWLKKLDLQVLNISLGNDSPYTEGATVIVNYPIVHSDLSCGRNNTRQRVALDGSPFIISQNFNTFVAIGCDNSATMQSTKSTSFLGCKTHCIGANTSRYSACDGFDCCQSTIPSNLQGFTIGFQTENNLRSAIGVDHDCQFAFLVYLGWFNSTTTDLYALRDGDYAPAMLQWGLLNDSLPTALGVEVDPQSYSYGAPSECRTTSYITKNTTPIISCFCKDGFDGNPYLHNGCEDINECEITSPDGSTICGGSEKCHNLPGSYYCIGGKRTTLFVVIGICSGLGSLLLVFLAWWTYKLIKKRKDVKLKQKFFKRNGGLILKQQLSSPEGNVERGKLFDSKELDKATDHFNKDRILGKGGQGTVYKGMLTDGRIVAIKKSIAVDKENIEPFINEVVILSQINHRNIVNLLGCCLDNEVPLLVYEFVPNGTLYQYLHDEEFPALWEARLRIAVEVAGALFYLHSSASIPIYHRDIKSSNILLDEKYRAKIADFGTSRSVGLDQTHVTTLVQGTFGYLDPEYFQSSQFTDKSDVYSFGVVLVELLTGQKPVSLLRANEGRSLAMFFIISMEENNLLDILDPRVLEQGRAEEITAVASLAKRCLNLKGKKRPTMKEVVLELEGIRNQEDSHHIETETAKGNAASFVSSGSEIDADVIMLSDIDPLLPSESW